MKLVPSLVASLVVASIGSSLVSTAHAEGRTVTCAGTSVVFAKVPAGTFQEGSPSNEPGRSTDEVAREVTLTHATYLGVTPVTVGAWKAFVAATQYVTAAEKGAGGLGREGGALVEKPTFSWKNPGFAQTDEHPVVLVTYADAHAFARWLSCGGALTIRLPTEAELERAMRGNDTSFGPEWSFAHGAAKEPTTGTHPVRATAANAFGLFDLVGHVAQPTEDMYTARTVAEAIDPLVADGGARGRVYKGGSWNDAAKLARPASRVSGADDRASATNGFRLAFVDDTPARDGGLVLFEPPLGLKTHETPLEAPKPEPASDSSFGADALVAVVCIGAGLIVWQAMRKRRPDA